MAVIFELVALLCIGAVAWRGEVAVRKRISPRAWTWGYRLARVVVLVAILLVLWSSGHR